ncbi:MAG: serine/threonine-protein kinase [Myxococcales bacterium]|jgi:serine/threonine-protein kinase
MSSMDGQPPGGSGRSEFPPAGPSSRRLFDPEERETTTVRVAVPDAIEPRPAELRMPPPGRTPVDVRGRYEDLGTIARGGMATVRRVFDRWILRQVALKRRGRGGHLELARFVEEVQITGQLDHPNIVPVHDVELDAEGVPAQFTMKLVQGNTLGQVVAEHPVDTLHGAAMEEFLKIFLKVCDAISFAHSRGVVHRDLKPDNVMVGSYGQVYVVDWGIAMLCDGSRPSQALEPRGVVRLGAGCGRPEPPGTLSGTPAYMAPEQAQGRNEDVDVRTDVFGLGGILYHFLTASAPFAGQDASDELILAMNGRVVEPQQRAPHRALPPGLCRIAMRALSTAPTERYPTVEALARDVEEFLRGGGWFESRSFEAGDVIIEQGAHAECAYIVVEGQCRVTRRNGSRGMLICTLGPGEVFGETALLTGAPRNASVQALTPVTALRVTRQTLERELAQHRWLQAIVDAAVGRSAQQAQELAELRAELARIRGGE